MDAEDPQRLVVSSMPIAPNDLHTDDVAVEVGKIDCSNLASPGEDSASPVTPFDTLPYVPARQVGMGAGREMLFWGCGFLDEKDIRSELVQDPRPVDSPLASRTQVIGCEDHRSIPRWSGRHSDHLYRRLPKAL
jgi:hypothetical protein